MGLELLVLRPEVLAADGGNVAVDGLLGRDSGIGLGAVGLDEVADREEDLAVRVGNITEGRTGGEAHNAAVVVLVEVLLGHDVVPRVVLRLGEDLGRDHVAILGPLLLGHGFADVGLSQDDDRVIALLTVRDENTRDAIEGVRGDDSLTKIVRGEGGEGSREGEALLVLEIVAKDAVVAELLALLNREGEGVELIRTVDGINNTVGRTNNVAEGEGERDREAVVGRNDLGLMNNLRLGAELGGISMNGRGRMSRDLGSEAVMDGWRGALHRDRAVAEADGDVAVSVRESLKLLEGLVHANDILRLIPGHRVREGGELLDEKHVLLLRLAHDAVLGELTGEGIDTHLLSSMALALNALLSGHRAARLIRL